MGILSRSGVGALPRIGTPLLAALTLVGNSAAKRSTRQRPAGPLVAGIKSPAAPRPSRTPVRLTRSPGLGNALGTMATRSSLVLVKWALAVNANIAAKPQATTSLGVERASTPNAPTPPNSATDAKSTIKTAMKFDSPRSAPARRSAKLMYVNTDIIIRKVPYVNIDIWQRS